MCILPYFNFLLLILQMSLSLMRAARFGTAAISPVAVSLLGTRPFSSSAEGEDRAFYTYGVNIARKMNDLKTHIKPNELVHLAQGFSDAITGKVSDSQEADLVSYCINVLKYFVFNAIHSMKSGDQYLDV